MDTKAKKLMKGVAHELAAQQAKQAAWAAIDAATTQDEINAALEAALN